MDRGLLADYKDINFVGFDSLEVEKILIKEWPTDTIFYS